MQPEERKKLLSLKEDPSVKDSRDLSKEKSPSTVPSIHMEDCIDGSEDKQTERESTPSPTSESVLHRTNQVVDAALRQNDSASSFGVLANSNSTDAGEGGGEGSGRVLNDDGFTEEERETVSYMYVCMCANTAFLSSRYMTAFLKNTLYMYMYVHTVLLKFY